MISIKRYTPADAPVWDAFVRTARNATFLFERAYMDYHSDRFTDHSLLCYNDKGALVAVLPANEADGALWSHQGLTYGGLLVAPKVVSADVLTALQAIVDYARSAGFRTLHYKPMPHIYHRAPAQDDLYALWRMGAQVEVCNLSAVIDLHADPALHRPEYCRRNMFGRLQREGYTVDWEVPLAEFWPILTDNLQQRYGASPVHTLDEMQRLQKAFPDQILCCVVRSPEGVALGGTVLYETGQVVHTQYSSASEQGKRCSALDYLYGSLLRVYAMEEEVRYFDFGTSNEDAGRTLNASLIHYKESLGGRGVVYQTYFLAL
ncbi:MAG: GNAT family N-acetyltransferase [Bacteroidales bacterium]|nr:GNAT family N-acetyltransferase [Bacteroidales bacterium]